jgi:hypothetical protein
LERFGSGGLFTAATPPPAPVPEFAWFAGNSFQIKRPGPFPAPGLYHCVQLN